MLAAVVLAMACARALPAQEIREGRFCVGDDPAWAAPGFDDSAWRVLSLDRHWELQGVFLYHNYAWYRLHVVIPSSLKDPVTGQLVLDLGPIDDTDETYLNGVLVGKTGSNPEDPEGFHDAWEEVRRYKVDGSLVRWDAENVIAVRVFNGNDEGGFYAREARVEKPALHDYAGVTLTRSGSNLSPSVRSAIRSSGTLSLRVEDAGTGGLLSSKVWKARVRPGKNFSCSFPASDENRRYTVSYSDARFSDAVTASSSTPYILTPPAPAEPRYNGPLVFGVRPGSPVIFRLAFSGERPMQYSVQGLPEGVTLDAEKGVLSGSVALKGDYPLVLKATNAHGSAETAFTLKVGDTIGLTPPMGWNAWNCWGTSVTQEKVMASAKALVERGLADYGYAYINVDDAWEAEERLPDGHITTNDKFPDMKGLGDWLHGEGLKLGIYSSPGDRTCGEYLGSLDHEQQDAETWNAWGVDYLKYDWCGYRKVFEAGSDKTVAAYVRPYLKMEEYLRAQPRDIFYSLCQYGMADVWTWGHAVDANSWRTTGDIRDLWSSVYEIGFELQPPLWPYAGPGHWNDPDMLVVGKVGWSDDLHESRLTPDEQYTHISLWSLLAANMLIGCDLSQIDDFTFNLLCNHEVNAVNQDILGVQARRALVDGDIQVWERPLSDGSHAVGIFNLGETPVTVDLRHYLSQLGFPDGTVRDLWRQADLSDTVCTLPIHGARLVKVEGCFSKVADM